ncbi:hypothetical protein TRAPUB_8385 [Trametes pubescens]|uniref:Uncharacterized protein n=1 Tax=Trametes pubescens TaxID=154538 RepID=A0A1M2W5A6_TRAPU|nr:hypothetical protein TRAPUB_8385 [Trametes pubescens]
MTTHYNLRSRAESPPPEPLADNGEFSSSLTSTSDAALDNSHTAGVSLPQLPSASTHSASERRPGVSYSQVVASRTPSPVPRAAEETASAVLSQPQAGEPVATLAVKRKHRVTVEDITDEDDGTWTTVLPRRRRAHSAGSAPASRFPVNARDGPTLTLLRQHLGSW